MTVQTQSHHTPTFTKMYPILIRYLFSALAGVLTILLSVLLVDIYRWLHLPAGPIPLPFIGNKLSLPQSQAWLQFDEWAKKYGPIFTIWIGRTPTLVVTSPTIAHELLCNNNFSTRPRSVVFGELYMKMASIIAIPYGKPWAIRRQLFHKSLKAPSLQLYKPRQEAEASLLAFHLLQDGGENWVKIADRYTAGSILTTGYGRRIESMDAKVIKQKLDYIHFGGGLIAPGRFWAETLPWLKYTPNCFVPWKKAIEKKGDEEAAFNISLVNLVRSDLAAPKDSESLKRTQTSSFMEHVLEMQTKTENRHLVLDDRSLAALGGSFFTAGFDTTASTIDSCLLALTRFPEVLKHAQAELDALLPVTSASARSPTFSDQCRLPYINALILETLRWRPSTPLGISHASISSSHYRGYTIPAGTTVIASTWSLNHDPAFYPHPEYFNPARFLPPESHLNNLDLQGGNIRLLQESVPLDGAAERVLVSGWR
jgi:cytochrome P450